MTRRSEPLSTLASQRRTGPPRRRQRASGLATYEPEGEDLPDPDLNASSATHPGLEVDDLDAVADRLPDDVETLSGPQTTESGTTIMFASTQTGTESSYWSRRASTHQPKKDVCARGRPRSIGLLVLQGRPARRRPTADSSRLTVVSSSAIEI